MTDAERDAQHARIQAKGRLVKWLTWALGILLALGMGSVVLISQYELQRLGSVAADTKRNSDRLVDCTTPGGKCYEQGRSTTSGAVGTINRVAITVEYCAGHLGPSATIAALNACVTAIVK